MHDSPGNDLLDSMATLPFKLFGLAMLAILLFTYWFGAKNEQHLWPSEPAEPRTGLGRRIRRSRFGRKRPYSDSPRTRCLVSLIVSWVLALVTGLYSLFGERQWAIAQVHETAASDPNPHIKLLVIATGVITVVYLACYGLWYHIVRPQFKLRVIATIALCYAAFLLGAILNMLPA